MPALHASHRWSNAINIKTGTALSDDYPVGNRQGDGTLRPRIFIGSSTKGLTVAELAQAELKNDAEPELWNNGIFRSTHVPIESLMSAVVQYDFGLFVLLPEDPLTIRDLGTFSVRDNVLFELGLFMGRLGRDRNFFISPRGSNKSELHLPSDLSGITPSSYDPGAANLQASVGASLVELKQSLRKFQNSPEEPVFIADITKHFHFEHRGGHNEFENGKPVGPRGEGNLIFHPDESLQIQRNNTVGRYEIELRPFGPREPTIPKSTRSERVFRVTFKAKIEGGAHEIRVVLKDNQMDRWADYKVVNVSVGNWGDFEVFLRASPTWDLFLRIDDIGLTKAPSSVFLSSLRVFEVS
jgi:predicted nucleotide-binding protein